MINKQLSKPVLFNSGNVVITPAAKEALAREDVMPSFLRHMTADFQCAIVRCAAELSRFSIWTLVMYIKKYVEVS